MTILSVVFHSGAGHTQKMAEAVHTGAMTVSGVEAHLLSIESTDFVGGRWMNGRILNILDQSNAIIFGSPTYMGCVSGQMKSFLDATAERYRSRSWANKVASGFTVSGGLSGDKLNSLQTLALFAMQHGMVWIGQEQTPFNDQDINRLGFYLGAAGQAMHESPDVAPNKQDKETGIILGARVASFARKLSK